MMIRFAYLPLRRVFQRWMRLYQNKFYRVLL